MNHQYILYGQHLSYYAGIVRAYMRCKNLDFEDRTANLIDFAYRIPRAVGAAVIPVLKTDQGEWLQDSHFIVNELEKRHPDNAMIPSTPKQLMASRLIEAWAAEFWLGPGIHWRWHYPGNREIYDLEVPRDMIPFAPFLIKPITNGFADAIVEEVGYGVGVRPENTEAIESWTLRICDQLDEHFAEHKYLLGDRPSIADFALCGPFYGHFSRDPASRRMLMVPRPNLLSWLDRTHGGAAYTGQWLSADEIPETLAPVINSIMNELFPMGKLVGEAVAQYRSETPIRKKQILMSALQVLHPALSRKQKNDPGIIPRFVNKDIVYPMGGQSVMAKARPFVAFKLQQVQDQYGALSAAQRLEVNDWLKKYNATPIPDWDFGPRMEREGIVTRFLG